jgi:hypothetical protein
MRATQLWRGKTPWSRFPSRSAAEARPFDRNGRRLYATHPQRSPARFSRRQLLLEPIPLRLQRDRLWGPFGPTPAFARPRWLIRTPTMSRSRQKRELARTGRIPPALTVAEEAGWTTYPADSAGQADMPPGSVRSRWRQVSRSVGTSRRAASGIAALYTRGQAHAAHRECYPFAELPVRVHSLDRIDVGRAPGSGHPRRRVRRGLSGVQEHSRENGPGEADQADHEERVSHDDPDFERFGHSSWIR